MMPINLKGYGINEQEVAIIETICRVIISEGLSSALPIGGTTGQVLSKASNANGDVSWQDDDGGSGSSTLAGITDMSANARTLNTKTFAQMRADLGLVIGTDVAAEGHTHANVVSSGAAGFMTGADKAKLDGVESGATADLTGAEIVALINAALGGTTWQGGGGGGGGATILDELSDVVISSPAVGHVLRHNGTNFVNVLGTTHYADAAHSHAIGTITGLGSGVATLLGTFNSANMRAALGDETGTGAAVFADSPTISAPNVTGIPVYSGSYVTTANAMGALQINTSAGLNTKSSNVDGTLTFNAQPATADTWFYLLLTNTDSAVHRFTTPSVYNTLTGVTGATDIVLAGGGMALLQFRWSGSRYEMFGDPGYLDKWDATVDPTVNDDVADGYGPRSQWLNATANTLWVCESNGAGAAVWHNLSATGGGGVTDGDKGDITVSSSGAVWNIDANAVTYAKIQDVSATARILGRKTAGAGDVEECTITEILDFMSGTQAQGDVAFRGASEWATLAAAANSKYFFKSGGAGADPGWGLPTDWGSTSAISSATTCNIGALAGSKISISGTTTITAFDNVAAGITKFCIATGDFTITNNANINCQGGKNIAVKTNDTFVATSSGGGQWRIFDYMRSSGLPLFQKVFLELALSDETTALTTGTKITFRMPYEMTLTENPRLSVTTAPTGANIIVDINEGGTSIMTTTKLSIDAGEKTSFTAATPAVLTDTVLANDAEMTVDVDQVGSTVAGAGLKLVLIGVIENGA